MSTSLFTGILFVLPIVVGLVTKKVAQSWIKTLIMVVLTGVTVAVKRSLDNGDQLSWSIIPLWIQGITITVASYYGVMSNIGLGSLAPNIGIGKAPADNAEIGGV